MKCDYLVIGSGIAGLTFAIKAAELGEVVIVTKKAASDSNTNWAQGGIATVMSPGDDFAQHRATLRVHVLSTQVDQSTPSDAA